MRVVIVGPSWPHRGGIAHHTTALCHALREAGHEAGIIGYERLYPDRLFPGQTQFEQERAPWAIESHRLADPLRPDRWLGVAREVRRRRPERVVFQWWHPFFTGLAFSALVAARRSGAEAVLLAHNVKPHEAFPLSGPLVGLAGGAADRVVVQSQVERERLPHGLRARAVVVPHPTYALMGPSEGRPQHRTGELKGPLRLLFFGLIRPYKGLDDLLEALALVRARGADIRLQVRGECYGEEGTLRARVARADLADAVDLDLRWVPDSEIADVFAGADAVALPYREATGSGVAALALVHGLPVVGTRVPALEAVLGGGGFLSEVGDTEALAEVLMDLWRVWTGPAEGWEAVEEDVRLAAKRGSWAPLVEAICG